MQKLPEESFAVREDRTAGRAIVSNMIKNIYFIASFIKKQRGKITIVMYSLFQVLHDEEMYIILNK